MSFTKYTGKSGASTILFGAFACPGWRTIDIEENGRPLPAQLDATSTSSSPLAYESIDDPLGGKTAPSSTVTVTGLLSVTDYADTGWTTLVPDASASLVVTTANLGDMWTNTMIFDGVTASAPHDGVVTYTAKFSSQSSAGVWSTDV